MGDRGQPHLRPQAGRPDVQSFVLDAAPPSRFCWVSKRLRLAGHQVGIAAQPSVLYRRGGSDSPSHPRRLHYRDGHRGDDSARSGFECCVHGGSLRRVPSCCCFFQRRLNRELLVQASRTPLADQCARRLLRRIQPPQRLEDQLNRCLRPLKSTSVER